MRGREASELIIRMEGKKDREGIYKVNAAAFETDAEARLVDTLRESGTTFVSLVAEDEGRIVGHILFTPVELIGAKAPLKLLGLAPMAVLPERQNEGIGSALVREGLNICREGAYDGVVVLGHPDYYPRFGFAPSVRFGITCEYDVPEEVFMAMELRPGGLGQAKGTVRYHPLFGSV